ILFSAAPCLPNLRRGPHRTLILEQPLKHADRCMKRRPLALRRLAVPATIIELFADETAREALRRTPEITSQRERAAIDAWLHFPFEERLCSERLVPPETRLEARDRRFNRRLGLLHAGRA